MPANEEYLKAQVRIDVGDIGKSAVHEIVFPVEATGGAWDFSFAGATLAGLAYPNTADARQAAMDAIVGLAGAGNVLVSLGTRGFVLEWRGALAAQPVPSPTVNGTNLTPPAAATGSVTVMEKVKGQRNHWTDERIEQMWARRDAVTDIETRFLVVKLDAIHELLGLVWTQVNEQTGDQQREYSAQFRNLQALEAAMPQFVKDIAFPPVSPTKNHPGQSVVGTPLIRDTVQEKFDRMRQGRVICR